MKISIFSNSNIGEILVSPGFCETLLSQYSVIFRGIEDSIRDTEYRKVQKHKTRLTYEKYIINRHILRFDSNLRLSVPLSWR